MCGRFALTTPQVELAKWLQVEVWPELSPRANITPTQAVLVLRQEAEPPRRRLDFMHWGLIPAWAKDPKIGAKMINARAETVAEKPSFRGPFKHRRCLIVADCFYEWDQHTRPKQAYRFALADERPFAFAGLWERWTDRELGETIESCTIITTAANEALAPYHERMPVILAPEDYALWLDPAVTEPQLLLPLLKQYPAAQLRATPIDLKSKTPPVLKLR